MSKRRSYYDFYSDFEPSRPIETRDGIKARSQRGAFAKNWWATRWIEALERLMDSGRLSRGRSYARKGQVLSIEETRGGITAKVQGSQRRPYKVTIQVTPLTDAQWEQVVDQLASQALFSAQLLSGEMPQNIEEAFQSAGADLFPARTADLKTDCSCPDWANPCKHVAATHFILGERFDEDPFLIFRLRGRTQEQILQALRLRRASQDEPEEEAEEEEPIVPLEEELGRFWNLREPLESVTISINPPAIETPLLRRLGEPNFIPSPGLLSLLNPAYRAISQSALKQAFDSPVEEREQAES